MATTTESRARWLAAPAAAVVLAIGVWVTGGLITDNFRASMALTGAWFAACAVAAVLLLRRDRGVGVPASLGFSVAAAVLGGYLGVTTLRDRVAHERVAVGVPASRAAGTAAAPANVEQARGRLQPGEHATRGVARIVRLADGRRVLTLTEFATSAGPDLRVRVARGASTDGGDAVDLGALKGNRGSQQYVLPSTVRGRGDTVLIWCRAFSALFGSARLRAS
jgi:hypothetical protein